MLLGDLIALIFEKKSTQKSEEMLQRGVLHSSGIIASESLMGMAIAGLIVLDVTKLEFGFSNSVVMWFTVFAAEFLLIKFVFSTKPNKAIL